LNAHAYRLRSAPLRLLQRVQLFNNVILKQFQTEIEQLTVCLSWTDTQYLSAFLFARWPAAYSKGREAMTDARSVRIGWKECREPCLK